MKCPSTQLFWTLFRRCIHCGRQCLTQCTVSKSLFDIVYSVQGIFSSRPMRNIVDIIQYVLCVRLFCTTLYTSNLARSCRGSQSACALAHGEVLHATSTTELERALYWVRGPCARPQKSPNPRPDSENLNLFFRTLTALRPPAVI